MCWWSCLGWEARMDSHGRVFYIDHNSRTTTWQRPTSTVTDDSFDEHRRQLDRRFHFHFLSRFFGLSRPGSWWPCNFHWWPLWTPHQWLSSQWGSALWDMLSFGAVVESVLLIVQVPCKMHSSCSRHDGCHRSIGGICPLRHRCSNLTSWSTHQMLQIL